MVDWWLKESWEPMDGRLQGKGLWGCLDCKWNMQRLAIDSESPLLHIDPSLIQYHDVEEIIKEPCATEVGVGRLAIFF